MSSTQFGEELKGLNQEATMLAETESLDEEIPFNKRFTD
jgi:hypothetical protein